jgi:hypothetical protein
VICTTLQKKPAGVIGYNVSNMKPQTMDKAQMNSMKHEDSVLLGYEGRLLETLDPGG